MYDTRSTTTLELPIAGQTSPCLFSGAAAVFDASLFRYRLSRPPTTAPTPVPGETRAPRPCDEEAPLVRGTL